MKLHGRCCRYSTLVLNHSLGHHMTYCLVHMPQVGSADDLDPSEWQVPPHCIPIHANVTTFDWSKLSSVTSFDVIMMDPPWQLATANPTRGVALGYSQLTGERADRANTGALVF